MGECVILEPSASPVHQLSGSDCRPFVVVACLLGLGCSQDLRERQLLWVESTARRLL